MMTCGRGVFLGAGVLPLLTPVTAAACAVCGLDSSGGLMGRGFSWGILFLMAMPFALGGAIGGGLVYMHRRGLTRQNSEIRNSNLELEHVPHKETTQ